MSESTTSAHSADILVVGQHTQCHCHLTHSQHHCHLAILCWCLAFCNTCYCLSVSGFVSFYRYIGAINSGAVPAIATAWENVTSAECSRVANEVETTTYVAKFAKAAETCPPEELPLMTAHAEAFNQAVAVFERQAVCPVHAA